MSDAEWKARVRDVLAEWRWRKPDQGGGLDALVEHLAAVGAKIVPVEATTEMAFAFIHAGPAGAEMTPDGTWKAAAWRTQYAAMLAAAPQVGRE